MAIDKKDFEDFLVDDNLHVAINAKDFKAVIANAEMANATITARYTRPCRPLQLAYEFEGVISEFTLMTRGEADNDNTPSASRPAAPELSARQTPVPVQVSHTNGASNRGQMPPPPGRSIKPLAGNPAHSTQRTAETSRPSQSIDFDSLFVPADDDRQWDVPNDEDEAVPEDTLGWDATGEQVCLEFGFIESGRLIESKAASGPRLRDDETSFASRRNKQAEAASEDVGIPPTQRISQVSRLSYRDAVC